MKKFSKKDRAELIASAIRFQNIVNDSRSVTGQLRGDLLAFAETAKTTSESQQVSYPLLGVGMDTVVIGSVMIEKLLAGAGKLVQAMDNGSLFDAPETSLQFVLVLKDELDGMGSKRTCGAKVLIGGCSASDAITIQLDDAILSPGMLSWGDKPWETSSGHTLWSPSDLVATLVYRYRLTSEQAADALRNALNAGVLATSEIDGKKAVYLESIRRIDQHIANLSIRKSNMTAVADITGLNDEQAKMVADLLVPGPVIRCVNAPGGTGKTHSVSRVVDAFMQAGHECCCAAPTGIASKVLNDSLKSVIETDALTFGSVVTIDRARVQGDKLTDARVLVVDEASMISTVHLSLLSAMPNLERVILLGDLQQLKPVASGSPFHDLAQKLGFCKLTKNMRLNRDASAELPIELQKIREGSGRIHKFIKFADQPRQSAWDDIRHSWTDYDKWTVEYTALRTELDAAIDNNVQILAHSNALVNAIGNYTIEYLQPGKTERVMREMAKLVVGAYFGFCKTSPCDIARLPVGSKVYWTADRHGTDARIYRGYEGTVSDGCVVWQATDTRGLESKVALPLEACDGKAMPVQAKTVHKSQGQSVEKVLYIIKRVVANHDQELAYTASSRAKQQATVLSLCEKTGSIQLTKAVRRNTILGALNNGER